MSETISQLPIGLTSNLSDIIPLTQGSSGSGTGTTRKITVAKVLSASEVVYAGDPAFAGGVLANGTSDDTTAWNAAFATAATTGAVVFGPIGVSKVSSFIIPSNVILIGRNVESRGGSATGELAYASGPGSTILGTVILANSSATPIIMSAYSQLRDITVIGTSVQTVVNATAGRATLENVNISAGSSGINFNTTLAGGSSVINCRIHGINGNGIDSPVNCIISGNIINNSINGISLLSGCNGNLIVGNRIEWCSGNGITLNGSPSFADRNAITGNWIDRPGGNGIFMNFAAHTTVTGNSINRAGRNQQVTPGNLSDASFNLTNCTGITIHGNSTAVWGDDSPNPIGYNSPFYAIFDGGGNLNCVIGMNILAYHNNANNSTTGPINTTTTFNLAAGQNPSFWEAGRTV